MKPHHSHAHPPAGPRRVMVIDDHPMMRAGLVQLINSQPHLEACAEAGTPAEALSELARTKPDLVIADLSMPGRSGIDLIKDLHALSTESPILVISMQDELLYAERALRAGARGYIMKEAGAKLLLEAMQSVLTGGSYVSPAVASRILLGITGDAGRRSKSPIEQLTDREFEIYQLIGQGKDSVDIAHLLRLSRKTVDVHRGSIKRKLGLPSGAALIHHAVHAQELGRNPSAPGNAPTAPKDSS